MKKNYIFLLATLIGIISISCFLYFLFLGKSNIEIKLKNNTNSTINNLKIVSESLENIIDIPPIKPNETYEVKINSSEQFTNGEASIVLEHTNEQNQKEFFTIIGYIEKGSGENVKIILKNYKDGKLIIVENGEELHGISKK